MTYSPELTKALNRISLLIEHYRHKYFTVEHFLRVILDTDFVKQICSEFGVNRDMLISQVDAQLEQIEVSKNNGDCVTSSSMIQLLDSFQSLDFLDVGDAFLGVMKADETWAQYILLANGFDKQAVADYVAEYKNENSSDVRHSGHSKHSEKKTAELSEMVNMTEEAKLGKYDKLIGRKEELTRTIEILCRRQKNNPIYVGESGVGKTAITEGLAKMIADGKVPDKLKGYQIFSLDVASMVAGTQYRGQFEKRLKKAIKAIIEHGKAIIYIDEIHTIVGAGDVSGSLDLGAILKPYLSRGQIRCIGSTTYDDFKTKFQKDKALARRFQKIDVVEPTQDETIQILKGLKSQYEKFHNVKYSDEVIKYIVEITGKYLNERHFPDKAIDVMDELGSHAALYQTKQKKITKNDVEQLISRIAKIPVSQMSEDDMTKMSHLEDDVKQYIYAQDEAIDKVCNAIKCHRVGLGNPDKPIGSFLFIGPTGVGKTELCRVLAKILGLQLIRYDMSEFMEKHTISRLLGAPPGYVGYEEGTSLTDKIQKNPHSILLLDEIEKAHPDIFNSLLQIMDYATITDSTGRQADFRNVLIIMTSNVGSAEMNTVKIGFNNESKDGGKVGGDPFEAVKNTFSPEFRNRLDDTILFNRLEKSAIVKIVNKYISQLADQMSGRNITFHAEQSVIDYLADKGYEPLYGARPMSRLIQSEIRTPLTNYILAHSGNVSAVKAVMRDGKIAIEEA